MRERLPPSLSCLKRSCLQLWPPLFLCLLCACSLKELLPEGPVLSPEAREALPGKASSTPVKYDSKPLVPFPVLPLMGWGAAYDVDIVIVTRHPKWNMHEYARITTPDGPIWLAKDARQGSREQSITVALDNPYDWLPEIPVPRYSWPVEVHDRSSEGEIELDITYRNPDGELTEATYRGPKPSTRMKKRNGSTMGHSRQQLMAALDIPRRDFGSEARVTYDGKSYGIKRILGLAPFRMAIAQTQGGLATGNYVQRPTPAGLETEFSLADGSSVSREWTIVPKGDGVDVIQESPLRSLIHHFARAGDALELQSISVDQWGREVPVMHIVFLPPLPDFRRRFEGKRSSTFLLDINGQESHAVGRLEAGWTPQGPRLELVPEAPWWVADRPMETRVTFKGEEARVVIQRVP